MQNAAFSSSPMLARVELEEGMASVSLRQPCPLHLGKGTPCTDQELSKT